MEILNARDEKEFEAKTTVLLNRKPATAHYIEKKIDLEEIHLLIKYAWSVLNEKQTMNTAANAQKNSVAERNQKKV